MVFVSNNIRSNGFGFAPEWTPKLHGKLANHNFCEEDYRYTSYIAEFHNTWSSLPIIFYGSVGPYYTRKYATKELRFSFAFISIGAVGIGSALFHGTLLRIGQVFDEVPMLCIIFVGIFCFVENQKLPKYGIWFPIALITSCLFLVAAYLIFYWYSLFLVAFSGGVILLLIRGVIVLKESPKLSAKILQSAALSIMIGFTCWMVDDQYCNNVQWMRLHIGWHIGTGFGGYMFVMFLLTLRAKTMNKKCFLVFIGFDGKGHWLNEECRYCNVASSIEKRPPLYLLPFVRFDNIKEDEVEGTKKDN
jgi:dihydroceramidase